MGHHLHAGALLCLQRGGNAQAAADIAATSSPTITISISKTPLQPVLAFSNPHKYRYAFTKRNTSANSDTHPLLYQRAFAHPHPDEHYITGIVGHRQSYSISCESSSAADWANFFGLQTYESQIQFSLPQSDNPDLVLLATLTIPGGRFLLTVTVCMPNRWRMSCVRILGCLPAQKKDSRWMK